MSITEEPASAGWETPLAGVRRVTPASLAAQRAARQYAGDRTMSVKRIEALQLAKRAAAAMGLKAAKIAMIDKLFGYSPAADWNHKSTSPIVWPSNDALARQLGLSVSTARHHLRGLAAAGLIAHSSHPTFQRRGVRDKDGNIIEAFGIDLSPIIMRYDELIAIAETFEREGRERRGLSYRRTQLRREIEGVLEAARRDELAGNWQQFRGRLDRLRETEIGTLDQLHELIESLAAFRDEVEEAFRDASSGSNLDTAVTIFRPVQTTAESSSLNPCNRAQHHAQPRELSSAYTHGEEKASERKSAVIESSAPRPPPPVPNRADDMSKVSLSLMQSACPSIATYATDAFASWGRLREAGRLLSAAAGINLQVWQEAQIELGPDTAISALAITFQKTKDGLVLNPGAYLRSLVQRGTRGELFVSRSLFALANARGSTTKKEHGFPPTGSIHYTRFADIARANAPKPTPDIDRLAEAFRAWARRGHMDIQQSRIDKAFIGFCRKWKPQ